MSAEQVTKEELRCEECDRPVIVERWLIDPPHVICTDCEEKINNTFWEALMEDNPPVRREDIV